MGIVAGHPGEAAPDGVSAITTDVYWISPIPGWGLLTADESNRHSS